MSSVREIRAWADKARALDRYRWLLLRERHGVFSSALRFLREALSDLAFGLRARWRLRPGVEAEPCDFLLLQSAPKVIALRRKILLIERLRSRGHVLVETALPDSADILAQRLLLAPAGRVPWRYFGYAAHAQWLVARHAPRILLNDRNGSLYAPFLRLALNERRHLLVHLAHATTVERSRRLSMNDYDFYFLFGQSSLQALQARRLLFGQSRAVLSGSHMIDRAYELPAASRAVQTLLVLGVGPDKEKQPGYQQTYRLLREWAEQNPHYRVLVKAHPRSQVPFWQQAAAVSRNIAVLPPTCSLAAALEQASLVVNIMSNAVIEAALARRPVIYANASGEREIFSQEQFLGARVTSRAELQQRIAQIETAYAQAVDNSARFAEFHLAHGCQGLECCVETLELLLNGRQPLCESVILPPAGLS